MNPEIAQEKIQKLANEIRKLNHAYYVDNKSIVADFEFDSMLKELQDLEQEFPELSDPNSPTKRVGGDITKKFKSVVHRFPMLSLSNTYSEEEIVEWETRIKKLAEGTNDYVCELKYDGVAIGIRYENGQLTQAVTRGDGTKGEDVSTNVKTIRTVPLQLNGDFPQDFEIRGEIFFPLENFIKMNEARLELGEPAFANPRNSASGTLKSQDSKVVADRGLDCLLYGVYGADLPLEGHYESVLKAKEWGFKIPSAEHNYITKVNSIDEIMDFIHYWDKKRSELPFEIDGVVIKVNDYNMQNELGFTAKSPRWAIAYKFKTERVSTELETVTYQVGRTGAITPVANLTAVNLGGTVVKRASLHNADQIAKLDLHQNDTVFVEKGGEIIPKIVGVDLKLRKSDEKVRFLENCPECDTPLIRKEGEAQHFCPNELGCPPQIKGRIEHFIGRRAMDIEGIGAETVDALVNLGLIQTAADLYSLTFDEVVKLERMADKSADNLIKGIEKSKENPFEKVLFGIGIRYAGETVAKKLAKRFKSMENLSKATYDELVNTDEIGEVIAISVQNFFLEEKNVVFVNQLKEAGLKLEIEEKELASAALEGKIFVVSGVFQKFSRDELKATIESNGGKIGSSISKKTTFVVAGENMGPAKLQKASDLGIEIIDENSLIKMVENG
ncbi:NAD-dependent DNA ligase LigA [Crocinitomicaceae bacterium]|nr:NAD-dependent DNA ligase LigA [Crocinitomicaceae bacterium]